MNKKSKLLAILLFALPLAAVQADEGDWYIGLSPVFTDDDGDRLLNDSIAGAQINVGWEFADNFALDGHLGYSDIDGWQGISQEHLDISLNLLSRLNPGGVFSPYVILGAGYLGTTDQDGSEENRPSATLGTDIPCHHGDNHRAAPWR